MQSDVPPSPPLMPYEILALRAIHVLCGVFWVGGGLYATLFTVPAITMAGPAAAPIFAELQRRKLFTVVPLAALATMLSGLRLLWIVSGGYQWSYFQTLHGATYGLAGLASIVGFLLALLVSRPASLRLGALMAAMATMGPTERAAAETQARGLKRQASLGTGLAVGLVVVATLGMALGRYL